MKQAQLQISFQWILVIVGGGALLVMFWFLIKGATTGAEQTNDALSIRNAGTFLSGTAWQPDTRVNRSMPAMTISCDADVVTLNGKSSKYPLSGVPAFLPPQLSGETVITTASWKRPIPLGSHLYALDRDTKIIFLDSSGVESAQTLRTLQLSTRDPRVMMLSTLNDVSNQEFSSELHTITIVAFNSDPFTAALPPNSKIPDNARGLFVKRSAGDDKQGNLTFYTFNGRAFVQQAKTTFSSPYLLAGAIVAGDSSNYLCGKQVVERRAKIILKTAMMRLQRLTAAGTSIPAECGAPLTEAKNLIGSILSSADSISRIQQEESRIKALDDTLVAKGCPGIA